VERLCWANVQLICFCLADEQQVNCDQINENYGRMNGLMKGKRSSIALETYSSGNTSFHECLIRAEKGIILYSSNPKILFCDLQLAPSECQTFVYTETLPPHLNPSYSSPRIKYHYKLTIGTQRIGSPIRLFKIPIRILTTHLIDELLNVPYSVDYDEASNGFDNNNHRETSPASSVFNNDESRDDSTPLDLALHMIEYQTCHRTPHSFNITSTLGRVAKFFIFKTVYRLGEDIIGVFNFSDGVVPCLRFSVALQSEETISESYQLGSKSAIPHTTSHSKCQEYTFNTTHTQMVLTIPLTATPSFANEIGKLLSVQVPNLILHHFSSSVPSVEATFSFCDLPKPRTSKFPIVQPQ